MRKIAIILITILATISCKKDETATITPRLKNCNIEYLLFYDDIDKLNNMVMPYPYDTSGYFCSYFYENDIMTLSTGIFREVPWTTNGSEYWFSENSYDSIQMNGDSINVFAKHKSNETPIVEEMYNPTVYLLDSQKRLTSIKIGPLTQMVGLNRYYTYSDNLITEKNPQGVILRKFYFENNNLVKVAAERIDNQGILLWNQDILFKDFDNNPNPFKNMFFVKGAFYRAFSENNYQSYTINEYTKLYDGTYGLYRKFTRSKTLLHNSAGYPLFGDYE